MISSEENKAALVDRDGVFNELVDRGTEFFIGGVPIRWTAPFHRGELRLKPNVREALDIMRRKRYLPILVTNQPDVANGLIDPGEFERMMDVFREMPFADIFICNHRPGDGCACRKPAPGMLIAARDIYKIDMARSFMIGDMETDIQAGRAVGTKTILVTNDLGAVTIADHRVLNIMEAALLLP